MHRRPLAEMVDLACRLQSQERLNFMLQVEAAEFIKGAPLELVGLLLAETVE